MAGPTPFVLPQFQGSLYDLQRQQALAQALTQGALTPQQTPAGAPVGPYQVQARTSVLAPLSQLAQGLMAARMGQDVAQGMNNLGLQQQQMMLGTSGGMGAMSGAMNGGASPLQQPPADQPGAAVGTVGGADAAPGYGGVSDQLSQQGTPGLLEPGGPMNPLGMPKQQAYMMLMQSPDKYWEAQAGAYKPSDLVAQMRAAGVDPNSAFGHAIGQQILAKSMAPDYVSGRPGGYMLNRTTGEMEQLPNVPEGFTAVRGQNGWQIVPVQGGLDAMGSSAAAKASGNAQYQLKEVWDPSANAGQGGYVQQSVANVANAANGGVPGFSPFQNAVRQVESSGRAAAVNPASGAAGSMQTMPSTSANPGFGVRPAANNSPAELQRVGADYATAMQQKYGNDADAAVAYNWGPANADKWIAAGRPWKMLPDETKAYVGQVMTQQQNFAGSKPQGVPQSGPMASQPPLGATSNANASQQASAETMKSDYEGLQSARQNAPVVLQAYDHLIDLAKRAPSVANGGLGGMAASSKYAPFFSSDAAEYDKTRAFLISTLGKDLGKNNSDAARATISQMIPEYGKPLQAKLDGLQQGRDQVAMKSLRASVLTPAFQAGDSKGYTDLANQFDNNVRPSMVPVLQMQGDAQRAAVQAAIRANPSLRANFEWAFNNGMLK